MKKTECNLNVVDFILIFIMFFLLGLFVLYVFFKCLDTILLMVFGFIVFFPMLMLTDDFSKDFDFIPGCIVKILRIAGIAELVGLVGHVIWFVFIY